MAFIVEMVGGVEGNSWHFCCNAWAWDQILKLARENGWNPLGTRHDPVWREFDNLKPDYECDDYGKITSAQDAAGLADALERASKQPLPTFSKGPVLIREGMTATQCRRANAELDADFMVEFTGFLRNGEFSFFWDD